MTSRRNKVSYQKWSLSEMIRLFEYYESNHFRPCWTQLVDGKAFPDRKVASIGVMADRLGLKNIHSTEEMKSLKEKISKCETYVVCLIIHEFCTLVVQNGRGLSHHILF